ncbi:hypothetical protein HDU96_001393 [Phlyctochytrium bullatum]|nr:hypothetical protein HDU96_001393 [Phlyctochytrium bullatum]
MPPTKPASAATDPAEARAMDDRYAPYLAPWPVKIHRTATAGRNLTTTRPITPGTPILTERPVAFSLLHGTLATHCTRCLGRLPPPPTPTASAAPTSSLFANPNAPSRHHPHTCGGCARQALYCTAACMQADQERHARECAAVKELPGIAAMHKVDYTLLRLVVAVVGRWAEEEKGEVPEGEGGVARVPVAFLEDLETHEDEMPSDWRKCVLEAVEDLYATFATASPLLHRAAQSPQRLFQTACRINVNSHAIPDPGAWLQTEDRTSLPPVTPSTIATSSTSTRPIAVGLFPLVAIINHSCDPSASYVAAGPVPPSHSAPLDGLVTPLPHGTGAGGTMVVRAIASQSAHAEVSLSYVDLYSPAWERRAKLLATKFFVCQCPRCANPASDTLVDGILCGPCTLTAHPTPVPHTPSRPPRLPFVAPPLPVMHPVLPETPTTAPEKYACAACGATAEPAQEIARIDRHMGLAFAFADAGMPDSVLLAIERIRGEVAGPPYWRGTGGLGGAKPVESPTTPAADEAHDAEDAEEDEDWEKVPRVPLSRSWTSSSLDASLPAFLLHPAHRMLVRPLSTLASHASACHRFDAAAHYLADLVGWTAATVVTGSRVAWPELADFWCSLGEACEVAGRLRVERGREGGVWLRAAEEAFGVCKGMRRVVWGKAHPRTVEVDRAERRVREEVEGLDV